MNRNCEDHIFLVKFLVFEGMKIWLLLHVHESRSWLLQSAMVHLTLLRKLITSLSMLLVKRPWVYSTQVENVTFFCPLAGRKSVPDCVTFSWGNRLRSSTYICIFKVYLQYLLNRLSQFMYEPAKSWITRNKVPPSTPWNRRTPPLSFSGFNWSTYKGIIVGTFAPTWPRKV